MATLANTACRTELQCLLAPHTADIVYARERTAEVGEITYGDS